MISDKPWWLAEGMYLIMEKPVSPLDGAKPLTCTVDYTKAFYHWKNHPRGVPHDCNGIERTHDKLILVQVQHGVLRWIKKPIPPKYLKRLLEKKNGSK